MRSLGVPLGRGVFINYRGEDSHSYGALLYTELSRQFGADQVFLDCESIPAGADFAVELLDRVRSAGVLLAVIGPRWLTATDDSTGRPRIEDPADWIRRELAEAFAVGVRVIPILTDGAELPPKAQLPADIAALSHCQARHLRRREPMTDLARIVTDLTTLSPALARHRPGPGVTNTATDDVSGNLVQAGTIHGGVHFHPTDRQPARVRVGTPPILADQFQHRDVATALATAADAASAVVLTPVLSGTGGVGKTQLAADYATRHWTDPDLRLAMWISARSRDAILAAYAQAAVDLLHADQADPEQAAARLLAWLASTDQRWLIVLDDLQQPEDLRHLWPPINPHGRTVVTTRRRDASLARTDRVLLDVGVFTPADATAYLHAKLADHPHLLEGADGLAVDVGYLPLALAQAVAYLINRDLTCQRYRDRLADRHRTLHHVLPEPGELPDDHDRTVAATFALSLDLADTLTPVGLARPVMLVACLLDPTGIPWALFDTQALLDHLHSADADAVHDALHLLHRLNLATVDRRAPHRAVRVHALVQRATREAHDPDQVGSAARGAADALVELWPDIEQDTVLAQALRANTEALNGAAGQALWDRGAYVVLFRAGRSLGEAGLVTSARDYQQALHAAADQNLGADHPDTLITRNNLANSRGQAGDPAGAAAAFEGLLADNMRMLGPAHPDTLVTRGNLAYWRGEAGDPAGAADAFEALLADHLRVVGPDHPSTLAARGNLASWRGRAGDLAGGVDAFEELLADYVRVLGPDHPDTLATRDNIAYWRGEAGDPAGAADAFEALLADQLRVLGPDHPDTLATRGNLAEWRGRAGDLVGVVDAIEELLADLLRVIGPDHPGTLTTRSNLANWRGRAGDLAGAVAAFDELLVDYVRVLGPDHPSTLAARGNLASWRGEAGDLAGAVAAFEELLPDHVRVLGPDHPDTLTTRNNLANWRGEAGDPTGAAAAFDELLADHMRVHGPAHPNTLITRDNLARWRAEAGDPAGAADATEDLLADLLRVLGPDHPDTLTTRNNLASWRGRSGDLAGAVAAFDELLADRLRVLGPDHPDTLATRGNLASWRGRSGDLAGAVAALEELLADYVRVLGLDHPSTLDIHRHLDYWRDEASSES